MARTNYCKGRALFRIGPTGLTALDIVQTQILLPAMQGVNVAG